MRITIQVHGAQCLVDLEMATELIHIHGIPIRFPMALTRLSYAKRQISSLKSQKLAKQAFIAALRTVNQTQNSSSQTQLLLGA